MLSFLTTMDQSFGDPEAAKRFEVLSAADKCPSAVLSHPREAVAVMIKYPH
jgi:hypothetical protein